MGERGLLLWSWNQREGVEPKKVWLEREGCLQHIGSGRWLCSLGTPQQGDAWVRANAPDRTDWPGRPRHCGVRGRDREVGFVAWPGARIVRYRGSRLSSA